MAEPQVLLSEREKYILALEEKISKIGRAKQFVSSEAGGLVTDLLTQEVNSIIKRIGGKTYLSDHEGYLYELGQLHLAQRMLNILNGEANSEVEPLVNKLKEAKNNA